MTIAVEVLTSIEEPLETPNPRLKVILGVLAELPREDLQIVLNELAQLYNTKDNVREWDPEEVLRFAGAVALYGFELKGTIEAEEPPRQVSQVAIDILPGMQAIGATIPSKYFLGPVVAQEDVPNQDEQQWVHFPGQIGLYRVGDEKLAA